MRYCEGLPEVGARPLRADEREALRRLAARLARKLAVRLALAVASPVAAFSLAVGAIALLGGDGEGRIGEGLRAVAVLLFFAGFLVGPAAALLSARDRWREWRRARLDLASGVALEFGDGARALSILPGSERVLARDGRPVPLAAGAAIGAAAAAPVAPPTYALPADALPAEGGARTIVAHGLVRRPLSAEERDELRAHVRGLRRIPRTFWLVAVWSALGAVQWLRGAERRSPVLLMLGLVLGLGLWRLHRARSLAARLEADAEDGWAIRATAGAASGDEALPASRAVWTAGGAPAPWRVGARR